MDWVSGIEFIRAIQSINTPLLDQFFSWVTNLHHEMVYILVLPALFWLYDKRLARYLFSVFALGFWTNDLLKSIFTASRPDPSQVRVLMAQTTHGTAGFPSGHSQTPLIFWGALALYLRQRWFWWIASILVFLIGLSRLYLGLHWPYDVLGGWAIGLLFLAIFWAGRSFLIGEGQSLATRLFWSVALPALAMVVSLMVKSGGLDEMTLTVVGAYAGLMIGSALEEAYVGFDPRRGGTFTQVLKVVIGLVLVLAVKEGFKFVIPDLPVGTGIRYFLVALTATLIAPWLFQRFLTAPPIRTTITRGQ